MAPDDKAEIVKTFDNSKLRPDGTVEETMIVRFMFGRLGPFELEVPRTITQYDLQRRIDERIAPFKGPL